MRKVLLISSCFPPTNAIGAIRPYKLAKYLPRLGWEAIILTTKVLGERPSGLRIIEARSLNIEEQVKSFFGMNPKEGFFNQLSIGQPSPVATPTERRRIVKLIKDVLNYPDGERWWYKPACEAASEFLDKEHVDAMISTSPSVVTHMVATYVKKRYDVPWIADFRDLWMQNHYYDKISLIRFFEERLEKSTISHANVFVPVSETLADILRQSYRDKVVHCITNGFDYDDFAAIPSKVTDKFTITYTGALYGGKRDPSLVFHAVKRLLDDKRLERKHVEIRFLGGERDWLQTKIEEYGLRDVVKIYGLVPREQALRFQKESQVLLLLLWDNKNEGGVYTGKIFEYLASGRPIIAVGGTGGIVKGLLDNTGAGRYAHNIETLEGVLLQYYAEFLDIGKVTFSGNRRISDYSYENIAERYAGILDEVASGNENG